MWVTDRDARLAVFGDHDYEKLSELFKPYFDELGLPIPERPNYFGPKFEQQIEAVFDVKPAVFSFVYGIPSPDILENCRTLGIKTVGAATTVDESIALENAGVDAIVATGFEAGGHRVSFFRSAEESLTGTFSLIPQVADHVRIPIIAAGGIADSRGIKAALALVLMPYKWVQLFWLLHNPMPHKTIKTNCFHPTRNTRRLQKYSLEGCQEELETGLPKN